MLERLKGLIDEVNYPYFSDAYLKARLNQTEQGVDVYSLARELCLIKAGIEELKLGDITIPSPRRHFLALAAGYRRNRGRVVGRADGQ